MTTRPLDPWDVAKAAHQAVQEAQDLLDERVEARDRAFVEATKTYTISGLARDFGLSRQMFTRILTRARDRHDTTPE